MNSKEEITENIDKLISVLFSIIEENTINEISDNISFILKSVENNNQNSFDNNIFKEILKSNKLTKKELVEIIHTQNKEISWIDLEPIYSDVNEIIILAVLVKVNESREEIRYHCALSHPKFRIANEKFDLNDLLK